LEEIIVWRGLFVSTFGRPDGKGEKQVPFTRRPRTEECIGQSVFAIKKQGSEILCTGTSPLHIRKILKFASYLPFAGLRWFGKSWKRNWLFVVI